MARHWVITLVFVSLAFLPACVLSTDDPDVHEECGDDPGSLRLALDVPPVDPLPPGNLGVVVLDVGQGDAAIIVAPGGCAALIDGGPSGAGTIVKANLAALGVTSLEFAIASHYHADHIGGLDEVDTGTGAVSVPVVYDRGGSYDTATFDTYAAHFSSRRQTAQSGEVLSLCGEVSFHVIAVDANGVATTNENAKSVVVRVTYGAFDAFFGGDLTGASPNIESSVAPTVGEIELYKVSHHGSSTSSNETFLATALPTVSAISVGANNSFGHPSPDAIARLLDVGTEIWQTEQPSNGAALGHIQIVSADGSSYTVTQGSATETYASNGTGGPPPPPPPACTTTITEQSWATGKKELMVRATCSTQPNATLTASADGASIGTMTFLESKGYYQIKKKLPSRPACVTVTASCGAQTTNCF